MVEIKWTLQSLEDMENIAEYIAKDSTKYAQIQIRDFFDSVRSLSSFPTSGRIVPETDNKNIREIIVGYYRVIYHIKNHSEINLLTIHHSKRLLKSKVVRKTK